MIRVLVNAYHLHTFHKFYGNAKQKRRKRGQLVRREKACKLRHLIRMTQFLLGEQGMCDD